jgi:DNA-directed RNA polymerase subunit RPC12/RpoP
MSRITFACSCGARFDVDSSLAGKNGRCNQCKRSVIIPGTSARRVPPGPANPPVATPVTSVRYACPHCGTTLEVPGSLVGQEAKCGSCRGRTIVPNIRPGTSQPVVVVSVQPPGRGNVTTPILISAIVDIIAGPLWCLTGCGIVIGIPMIVLAIFEFIFCSEADSLPARKFVSRADLFGVLEILIGLFNLASFVCGIVVLVGLGKHKRSLRRGGS